MSDVLVGHSLVQVCSVYTAHPGGEHSMHTLYDTGTSTTSGRQTTSPFHDRLVGAIHAISLDGVVADSTVTALASVAETDLTTLGRLVADAVPGRLSLTGGLDRRLLFVERPATVGGWVVADLSGQPHQTRAWPEWVSGRVSIVEPDRWLSVAELTEDAADRLARPSGMTADSSHRRREFQHRLLDYLARITRPALCVAGDLNVVEPDYNPYLPAFEDHDYAFYTGLLALGLRDAYRELNPTGSDHSWINPRFGSQRLDHTLVSPGAGKIRACSYDHSTRSEDLSDHAALLTTIGL